MVWILLGIVAAEIVVTYARVPAPELYHVSGSGLGGGASRALVFLNFPVALVALGVLAVAYGRLQGPARRALAIAAALLCALLFWPGVVRQSDLDARWINVPAAVGVGLAVALTLTVRGGPTGPLRGDRLRVALAAVVIVAALPWAAADLGFFLDGVPGLGRLFDTGPSPARQPGLPPFPAAVHHGHHHGMDGVLLTVSALLLSRMLPAVRGRVLGPASAAYLGLMLAYGLGNVANDLWLEQVVKRGWTGWQIPSVLEPRPSWAWATLLAGTVLVTWAWFGRARSA